jgi:hypothetical protein
MHLAIAIVLSPEERVASGLRRCPRFHLRFIPMSSSWLNLVERWFREITEKRIRRGAFYSVPERIAAIHDYIDTSNQNPCVFTWTASVARIPAKIAKWREALDALRCHRIDMRPLRKLSTLPFSPEGVPDLVES